MEKATAIVELPHDILADEFQSTHSAGVEPCSRLNSLQPIDGLVKAVLAVRRDRASS